MTYVYIILQKYEKNLNARSCGVWEKKEKQNKERNVTFFFDNSFATLQD